MAVPTLLLVLAFQMLWVHSEGGYSIAGRDYEYRLKENGGEGKTCIYASFKMKYTIYYHSSTESNDTMTASESIPKHNVTISGQCNESLLILSWTRETNFSTSLQFHKDNKKWWLAKVGFNFTFNNSVFTSSYEQGMQSYQTDRSKKFIRSFSTGNYFYCKGCKTYSFSTNMCDSQSGFCAYPCVNQNKSCSYVEMSEAVLYVGDIDNADKKLCEEDYIALQEIIVPAVVGGILALLLILIFTAYIVAYIRRKQKEAKSQYEPVGEYN